MVALTAAQAAGGSAAAGWFAALLLLTALLLACCYQRKQLRAAMQAGGMAPKRAKIDPNAFSSVAGAAGAAGAAGTAGTGPTYRHGRKRLASVVPEGILEGGGDGATAAADGAASSGRSEDGVGAASPMLLETKSCKGIRDAVIQRNGGGGLLSGAGPRSDARPTDSPKSGAAAMKRAQKARGDLFKRLFPNSHAKLVEEQVASGRAASGGPSSSSGANQSKERRDATSSPTTGRLIATRL